MNRILAGSRNLPALFAGLAVLGLCLATAHAQVILTQISSIPLPLARASTLRKLSRICWQTARP